MEAVPRLPMLSFEPKVSPESVSFGPKLKRYISEAYGEDGESYSSDAARLDGLRSAAVRGGAEAADAEALARYFAQLRALRTRFPMGEGRAAAVAFRWRDAYSGAERVEADARFEEACVLYNVAAARSQLGAAEARTTAASLKAAVGHFQAAAGALSRLREDYPQPPGCDLAPDALRFLRELCLAQAQDCILEKTLLDEGKPAVVGSVGAQAVVYYRNALSLLGPAGGQDTLHETLKPKLYNRYSKYINFKIAYDRCIVYLYSGMHAEEEQKMGERVAYFRAACDRLQEAKKLAKGIGGREAFDEAIAFTEDVVEGKAKAAKNENEFIYHEEVPGEDALLEPKPAPLAKDIPIDFDDPEVAGPPAFARLVPLGAHEAASVYSEEKAALLRAVGAEAEDKSRSLAEFLASLRPEEWAGERPAARLPQALVDRAAALAARPEAAAEPAAAMNELAGLREDAHAALEAARRALRDEEDECRAAGRAPSLLLADLRRELAKYSDAHAKADDSNKVLRKAMALHLANLKLLAQPLDVLEEKIPDPEKIDIDRTGLNEMKRVFDKATEMQKQRDALMAELRAALAADDVTPRLLSSGATAAGAERSALFTEELAKHAPRVAVLRQNFAAQERIAARLTELFASQAEARRALGEAARRREALVSSLASSFDACEDLLAKARKGVDFYRRLAGSAAQLAARARSACQVGREEREQLAAAAAADEARSRPPPPQAVSSEPTAPKLKDYLPYMSRSSVSAMSQPPMDISYLPAVRPAPLGSEGTNELPYAPSTEGDYYKNNPSYVPTDNLGTQYSMGGQLSASDNQYRAPIETYEPPISYGSENPIHYPANAYDYSQYSVYGQPAQVTQTYPQATTPTVYTEYGQNSLAREDTAIYSHSYVQNQILNSQTGTPSPANPQYYEENSILETSNVAYPTAASQDYNAAGYVQNQMGQMQISDSNFSAAPYQYGTVSYSATYPDSYDARTPDASAVYAVASANDQYYSHPATYQNSDYQPAGNPPPASAAEPQYRYSDYESCQNTHPAVDSAQVPRDHAVSYNYLADGTVGAPSATSQYSYSTTAPYQSPLGAEGAPYAEAVAVAPAPSPRSQAQAECHPGYGYSSSSGAYEYGSGYQRCAADGAGAYAGGAYSSAGGYPTTPSGSAAPAAAEAPAPASDYFAAPYGRRAADGRATEASAAPAADGPSATYVSSGDVATSVTYATEDAGGAGARNRSSASEELTCEGSADLLAGLDFSLELPTLTPQIRVPPVSESSVRKAPATKIHSTTEKREDEEVLPTVERPPRRDLFLDPSLVNRFTQEVKNLQKFVDSLTDKNQEGMTVLDSTWKEIHRLQAEKCFTKSSNVAIEHEGEQGVTTNVFPYDDSRIILKSDPSVYLNASFIKQLSPWCPPLILSSVPEEQLCRHFWSAVVQYEVATIVCLLTEIELQGTCYWPTVKGQDLQIGNDLRVSLLETECTVHWTERRLLVELFGKQHRVTHYHINVFPAKVVCAPLILLVDNALQASGFHTSGGSGSVLLQCDSAKEREDTSGGGRSALVALVLSLVSEVRTGNVQLLDILRNGCVTLCEARKNVLEDTKNLMNAYRTSLYYAQGVLCSGSTSFNGEMVAGRSASQIPAPNPLSLSSAAQPNQGSAKLKKFSKESFEDMKQAAGLKSGDMKDPLSFLDPLWSLKKK